MGSVVRQHAPEAPVTLRVLQAFETCGGCGVVIGRPPTASPPSGDVDEIQLALASRLGEREASGEQARAVVLRLHARDDARWVAAAMPWLVDRGRRVIVRTPAVLPRSLAESARERGVTVLLEIASTDAELQRALYGRGADPVPSLLLQAQHLGALGVPVSALVGPLLPVLHDRPARLEPLVHHVAAADIRDVRLSVGRLTPTRLRALQDALPWSSTGAIARAFGATVEGGALLPANGARLARHTQTALLHTAQRVAQDAGLRIDHCGCPAHCHLATPKPHPYHPLLPSDLFAS